METVFYKCPVCGNVMKVMVGSGVVPVCCGKPMMKMEPNTTDGKVEAHVPVVTCKEMCKDGKCCCYEVNVEIGSMPHPMTKEHQICFIYLETKCGGIVKFLKPEHEAKVKFYCESKPQTVFAYCNLHALWKAPVPCATKCQQ